MSAESSRRWFDIIASITTAIAAVATAAFVSVSWARTSRQPQASRPAAVDVDGKELRLTDRVRGANTAPVVVVEFSDFQCPYCRRYSVEVFPQVVTTLIDSGKVQYDFRSLPLENIHALAFNAGKAAECAGQQGAFWPMHDRLFAAGDALAHLQLRAHAQQLRLDASRFDDCLARAGDRVRADIAEAERLGIIGTPTFVIGVPQPNNTTKILFKMSGARTFEQIADAVEAAAGQT